MAEPGASDELCAFLSKLAGRPVELTDVGPASHQTAIGRVEGYPHAGLTTFVTCGASPRARSMWRGSPVHYELVLIVEDGNSREQEMVESLRAVLREEQRRDRERDRRPVIEVNGVWAPGYAPHLVFASETAAPDLMTRKKLGSRYVSFLAAVPIDDRELRSYDRSPADFVAGLDPETIPRYPRTGQSSG